MSTSSESSGMGRVRQREMIKSPIKWVGGKGRSASRILELLPADPTTYIEPFCGGFSVGLAYIQTTNPERVIASDLNAELINFWKQLKYTPNNLDWAIHFLESEHIKDPGATYQAVRSDFNRSMNDLDPTTRLHQAARFYYLNKCGFNGLYRVNKKGEFNTPRGDKTGPFADYENLAAVSKLIQNVEFIHAPYSDLYIWTALSGAVVYCDPPYVPVSKTANFVAYTSDGFDHEKFARSMKSWAEHARFVAVSNSATDEASFLFTGFNVAESSRAGTMNSKGDARNKVKELVFWSDGFATYDHEQIVFHPTQGDINNRKACCAIVPK